MLFEEVIPRNCGTTENSPKTPTENISFIKKEISRFVKNLNDFSITEIYCVFVLM